MATCPKCYCYFKTLEGEETDHPCPKCGWYYDIDNKEDE